MFVVAAYLEQNIDSVFLPHGVATSLAHDSGLGQRQLQHGGDRKSAEYRENQPDDISLKTEYGTSAAYLVARLKRDRPGAAYRENQGDVITLKTERGTGAAYLTARIARDRPDILERMKAGHPGQRQDGPHWRLSLSARGGR